jgi:hypothetical protein
MSFEELSAFSADIFKKIFPRVFIIYALLGAVPGALFNSYLNPGAVSPQIMLPLSLLLSVLPMLAFFIVFFYILAEIKNETLSLSQCFKKIGEALWPLITAMIMGTLLVIAGAVVISIAVIILTIIAAMVFSSGFQPGVSNPAAGLIAVLIAIPFILGFIYLNLRCYFIMSFCLMEKTEWFTPFKQSWQLTKGYFGKIFVILLITTAYGFIILLLKAGMSPLASFIAMLISSPLPFFLSIVFNALFFNLYYSKK